ncbi:MAG: 4-(cytidine 5'-diphospho)-2-C-methyl-D-erythritol kinase [Bacteroidaceae bacterium]|nr:4-(cytidine 5'-diphospho)-2-C-methyl-D-erythritol kinase [Bacteroidaceae bacterium]
MNIQANAKLNIGLNIISRRPDGYHNIESLFIPIGLSDQIEIIPSMGNETTLRIFGREIEGAVTDNLVMRAARMLDTPPVDIVLHKKIPTGAGLGGGSSDAAATMKLLNDMFELGMDNETMCRKLATLGADCPFFVAGTAQFAEGIGERLTPITLGNIFDNCYVALVKPPVHVSTKEAYSCVTPRPADIPILFAMTHPIGEWRNMIRNDFEKSVFATHPEIGELKQTMYDCGALYAQMSGSGSAVFGIFDREPQLPMFGNDHFVWVNRL